MSEKFVNTVVLLRHYLRRDWLKIILWTIGLSVFCSSYITAITDVSKGSALIGLYETMKNPAMIALVGPLPVQHAVDYTVGGMYVSKMLMFCVIISMVISAIHVNSRTRKEEESGLAELIRSYRVGRYASTLAVIYETLLINLCLVGLMALFMMSFHNSHFSIEGVWLFAASIGFAGMLGAALTLFFAQFFQSASSSSASTMGFIGLLYALRAYSDSSNIHLSYIKPFGWTYLTFPFTKNNWSLLIYGAIFIIVLFIVTLILQGHRDLGTGYLPDRSGHTHAGFSLQSVTGLLWHLSKGTILAWFVGTTFLGIVYGSIYGDMHKFVTNNGLIGQLFVHNNISIEASFTSTIIVVLMALVSVLPTLLVNKLFTEETRGHLDQLFVTKVTRTRLFGTNIMLAVLTSLIGTLLASGGLGLTAIWSIHKTFDLSLKDFIASGFNMFPFSILLIGISSILIGWLPRINKLTYLYLIYAAMLAYFKDLLNLPDWLSNTSALNWFATMPVKDFNLTPWLTILVIGFGFIIIGYFGYQRRDLKIG
ncbi:ABC transporter permease [Weissella paramesenteroides]|uniref:ABC transporter permease n=1 Tax=Weissella paramesenteroides TaxID=1249 RepID=UPI003F747113